MSNKIDKRTIRYKLLEYSIDGQYYGRSYPESDIPKLLQQLRDAYTSGRNISHVAVDENEVLL